MTPVKIQDEAQNLSGVKMFCFVSFHSLNSTVYEEQPIWWTLRNMRQIVKFHPPTRGTDMTQHCASHRIEKSIYIYIYTYISQLLLFSVLVWRKSYTKSFAFLQIEALSILCFWWQKDGKYIIILSISMYFLPLVRPQFSANFLSCHGLPGCFVAAWWPTFRQQATESSRAQLPGFLQGITCTLLCGSLRRMT